jgi:hypothetical protein
MVLSLLEELRVRQALDLHTMPSFERGIRKPKASKKRVDFILVGSSNADRTSDAIINMGYSVTSVHCANWRATSNSVASLLTEVKKALQEYTCEAVILQLLDNSVYLCKADDGSLTPSLKGKDGKYHVAGDLVIASKERQFEIFNLLAPLLDLVRDMRVTFVAPMLRYVTSGCCDDLSHVHNRVQRGYRDDLSAKLFDLKNNLKNFLFMNRHRNASVLDPAVDMRGMTDREIWGEDPVHPSALVYEAIARGVVMSDEKAVGKRRTMSDAGPQPGPKKSRDNSSERGSSSSSRGRPDPSSSAHGSGRGWIPRGGGGDRGRGGGGFRGFGGGRGGRRGQKY